MKNMVRERGKLRLCLKEGGVFGYAYGVRFLQVWALRPRNDLLSAQVWVPLLVGVARVRGLGVFLQRRR